MISSIDVVFHQDKGALWLQVVLKQLNKLLFLFMKVKAIGHQRAVKEGQIQFLRIVTIDVLDRWVRQVSKVLVKGFSLGVQSPPIFID
jgi:hypothetical protein